MRLRFEHYPYNLLAESKEDGFTAYALVKACEGNFVKPVLAFGIARDGRRIPCVIGAGRVGFLRVLFPGEGSRNARGKI